MTRTLVILFLVLGMAPLIAQATPSISFDLKYETTFASGTEAGTASTRQTRTGSITAYTYNNATKTITATSSNPNWISRFAVYVSVSGLAADQDLGTVVGKINEAGGTNSDALPWTTKFAFKASPVDVDFGYTLYTTKDNNTVNDLQALQWMFNADADWFYASQTTPVISPEVSPLLLGYVFVKWDGTLGATVSFASDGTNYWNYYVGNADGLSQTAVDGPAVPVSSTITFTPEPATLALLVLGGIGVLSRRRRA